jgi:mannosylglycoprotein endo-beta-mannosidase
MKKTVFGWLVLLGLGTMHARAQTRSAEASRGAQELNSGWLCRKASEVTQGPETLSQVQTILTDGWISAIVPGTVLTTLVSHQLMPDPYYGMNNKHIPDIYSVGKDYYTYWFVKDFKATASKGLTWLEFRGVNYGFDVYLNGHKLNDSTHKGMFLRAEYNITPWLDKRGNNRLAVIVYPPDFPGDPNGGQGGDGMIAKQVMHQYVAGWDWIQPIRDRNTGIWDKVEIRHTGEVKVDNPHIVTEVPGVRRPTGVQAPAYVNVSAELTNAGTSPEKGVLYFSLGGERIAKAVGLDPGQTKLVSFPMDTLLHPRLWWPNGYGPQDLYKAKFVFKTGGVVSDSIGESIGVRQIRATWNLHTRSREIFVNGQKIFIKGGNWIVSDAMLRLSKARYDAEIRFHRDMRLNLIRVWGGALTERPEFYDACDRYGLLVMQDFWNSGDCNGRWPDPKKREDQALRRKYPDDHDLFINSASDQIKMIRNHPSLAFWCGGNEITPPDDILKALKDSLIPGLDGTRWLADYSNTDSMSYNSIGGNGDGPYGIQPLHTFWSERTFPFNSEVGSVGIGDYASLKRFIPDSNMIPPGSGRGQEDSVWAYHKYIPYGKFPDAYGDSSGDVKVFTRIAQLLNYDQYRGLIEGFSSHMWDWYTGIIIWKTQNPWTAMRGQMYDYYLDPNACLYGLRVAGELVHGAYHAEDGSLWMMNNGFDTGRFHLKATAWTMAGKSLTVSDKWIQAGPDTSVVVGNIHAQIDSLSAKEGTFLLVSLQDSKGKEVSHNLYWLPDARGHYSGLQHLQKASIQARVLNKGDHGAAISISVPSGAVPAFFLRISVTDAKGDKRLLPVNYSDNYISVMPGEARTVEISWPEMGPAEAITLEGWNLPEQLIRLNAKG